MPQEITAWNMSQLEANWIRAEINVDNGELLPLRCARCGTRYSLTVPVSVSLLIALLDAFGEEHSTCKAEGAT